MASEAAITAMTEAAAASGATQRGQPLRRGTPGAAEAAARLAGQIERRCAAGRNGAGRRLHRRAEAVFDRVHGFSPRSRPSAASAREVVDLTVPGLMPMAAAISGSERSR